MGKILFIEDQLTRSIPTIVKLFRPLLEDTGAIEDLIDIQLDDYKTPEMIVEACSKASTLDICFKFSTALSKAVYYHSEYDLIIIDRNLNEVPYHDDMDLIKNLLKEIGFNEIDEKLEMYENREGDLILLSLLRLDQENKNKTFYLTANLDEIKGSPEFATYIDLDHFHKNHIIEKTTKDDLKLVNHIADLESFKIQNRFRQHVSILREKLNEDAVDLFVRMIKHYDADNRREFIVHIRKLLDDIMHSIAYEIGEPNAAYWNRANPQQLVIKGFIKGVYPRYNQNFERNGLPIYNLKHNINYSSIIRNACLSIFEICSDCGIHDINKSILPDNVNITHLTDHTMASMLEQMCDVILWYKEAFEKIIVQRKPVQSSQ